MTFICQILTSLNIREEYTIQLFSNLPPTIKILNDIKVFKPALKYYLFTHSSYFADDFLKNFKLYAHLYLKFDSFLYFFKKCLSFMYIYM
jgi:hypothetical protein